jgi:hypothetical protein
LDLIIPGPPEQRKSQAILTAIAAEQVFCSMLDLVLDFLIGLI